MRDAIVNAVGKKNVSAEKLGRNNEETFSIGDNDCYRRQAFETRLSLMLVETKLRQGLMARSK